MPLISLLSSSTISVYKKKFEIFMTTFFSRFSLKFMFVFLQRAYWSRSQYVLWHQSLYESRRDCQFWCSRLPDSIFPLQYFLCFIIKKNNSFVVGSIEDWTYRERLSFWPKPKRLLGAAGSGRNFPVFTAIFSEIREISITIRLLKVILYSYMIQNVWMRVKPRKFIRKHFFRSR